MELLIAIAMVIIVIAIILAGGEKSQGTSDKDWDSDASDKDWCSFKIELHSASKPEPFDYRASEWKDRSRQLREQAQWKCQACNLSLYRHKYYLHTHHIRGTLYNKPKDLRVLCIGCHSEQPGGDHYLLKRTRDYQGFMKRYGKEWRQESSEYLKRDYSETQK